MAVEEGNEVPYLSTWLSVDGACYGACYGEEEAFINKRGTDEEGGEKQNDIIFKKKSAGDEAK